MKYTEHRELSEQYRTEAIEALHRSIELREQATNMGEIEGYEEVSRHIALTEEADRCFRRYARLSKLANKHWGIYMMVCTQRTNRMNKKFAYTA